MKSENVVWSHGKVQLEDREKNLNQKSFLIWFTGLSGSGKSTVAQEVEHRLCENGRATYLLDGDNIRHGLNGDLNFSKKGREENIRRIGEVANLFVDSGLITLAAFISPFKKDRDRIRELVGEDRFIEVYVKCSLKECENRDVKGLYKKARDGEIDDFTGISSPYEEPESPEIVVETDKESLEESVDKVLSYIRHLQK